MRKHWPLIVGLLIVATGTGACIRNLMVEHEQSKVEQTLLKENRKLRIQLSDERGRNEELLLETAQLEIRVMKMELREIALLHYAQRLSTRLEAAIGYAEHLAHRLREATSQQAQPPEPRTAPPQHQPTAVPGQTKI